MRTHLNPLKGGLTVLLVSSAILFIVGSTIERHNRRYETTAAATSESSGGESKSGGETGSEGSTSKESQPARAGSEVGATILGVDTESLALSIVAVVVSLVLAGAVWLRAWPLLALLVLLGVVGFGLVFAAGDGRELVHQLDESNSGLASVAAILLVLHVAVAALAGLALRSGRRPVPAATGSA